MIFLLFFQLYTDALQVVIKILNDFFFSIFFILRDQLVLRLELLVLHIILTRDDFKLLFDQLSLLVALKSILCLQV